MASSEQAFALRNRAFALREEQEMEEAFALISETAKLLPDDPQTLFAHAQMAFETGRPALELFETAYALNASNPAYRRNRAAAFAAEGHMDAAVTQLEERLGVQPDWLDGHRLLANLRVTHGDPDPARSYRRAAQSAPTHLALRLAWFHLLSTGRQWDAARAVLDDGERLLGLRTALTLARAYVSSESGEAANDPHHFDALLDIRDPGLDLCQTRHWLRLGDPKRAAAFAERNIGTSYETAFWPYLSLAWRQTGDERAEWLDRPAQFIRSYDLEFTRPELQKLADTLRSFHTARAPFLEQSVRGGTQTDGNLFLRHETAIQMAKEKAKSAVRNYVDLLPPPEQGHPLLAGRRDRLLFEGSWSVRLTSAGYHSCHTHARGWISSALYVALPEPKEMGTAPAGWIEFGSAPHELGLKMKAYECLEPVAGRLILFPSTLWHLTLPFACGERLTLAFDVR